MNVGKHTVKWIYDTDFIPQHIKGKVVDRQRDITICQIVDSETSEVITEQSIAKIWSDPYCRDEARKISMSKTLGLSNFTREQRTEFWEVYRTQTKTPKWGKKVITQ